MMAQRLRVMTWNIRSTAGGDDAGPDHDRIENLRRIADAIRDAGVDIVGVQEVDRYWERSGGVDQARVIADQLGMEPAFVANWLPEGGARSERVPQYGVAILTRWPFVSVRHLLHDTPAGWEPRGAVLASIRLPNRATLAVANTHLQVDRSGRPASARDQRQRGLGIVLNAVSLPGIVMGDFNALPGSPELAALESGWVDCWKAANPDDPGHTFPALVNAQPRQRIDYLFASPGISVHRAEILIDDRTRLVSDHYPVIADVEVG